MCGLGRSDVQLSALTQHDSSSAAECQNRALPLSTGRWGAQYARFTTSMHMISDTFSFSRCARTHCHTERLHTYGRHSAACAFHQWGPPTGRAHTLASNTAHSRGLPSSSHCAQPWSAHPATLNDCTVHTRPHDPNAHSRCRLTTPH